MDNQDVQFTEEQKEEVLELLEFGDKLGAVRYLQENFQLTAEQALSMTEQLEEARQAKADEALVAEVEAATAGNANLPKLLGGIFGSIGLVLIVLAVWFGYRTNAFLEKAVPVTGKVVKFDERQSKDKDGVINTYIYPVIEYKYQETSVIYPSPYGSTQPEYVIGDEIKLLVDPTDPKNPEWPSFGDQWLVSILLGSIGLVFSGVGIIVVRAFRK